jgi:hypothetical protein
MHTHRCGYDTQDGQASGCGHRWEHDTRSIIDDDAAYEAAHICPNCGKGSWTSVLPGSMSLDEVRFRERRLNLGVLAELFFGEDEQCRDERF